MSKSGQVNQTGIQLAFRFTMLFVVLIGSLPSYTPLSATTRAAVDLPPNSMAFLGPNEWDKKSERKHGMSKDPQTPLVIVNFGTRRMSFSHYRHVKEFGHA